MTQEMKQEILALVARARTVYVASVDEDGFPNVKAMLALQADGLFTHYFSTNQSSRRTRQFLANPKACAYFCDERQFQGLMLVGAIEVKSDRAHKELLWREGFEMYYPDGIDTRDYCVYQFTAQRANYYHGLRNFDFTKEAFDRA